MTSTRTFARGAAAAALIALALPAMAGTISPRLRALASAYRQAPQAAVAQARRAVARSGTGIFMPHVSAAGKVQVYLHYRPGNEPAPLALDGLDASGVLVSRPLGVVQAWVPIGQLQQVADLAGVTRVTLPVYGMTTVPAGTRPATDTCNGVSSGLDIDKNGIVAQRVDSLHQQGVTGAGVKVGVISDGADCLSDSQAAGYLPSSVWVDSQLTGSGDEGTAMLEEVHAIAPDATLGFCGPGTTADFVQCYQDLATWGANVISDDLGFFPDFLLGSFDSAITTFAQNNPDINLATSAGNSRAGFFQGDYVAMTNPSSPNGPPITLAPSYQTANGGAAGRTYTSAMDFGAAAGGASDAAEKVTLGNNSQLYAELSWDDPASGPYDDLDLFLVKSDGTVACAPTQKQFCASTWDQKNDPADFPPGEFVAYKNTTGSTQTLYLIVYCYDCSAHGTNPLHIKLYGHMNGGGAFGYVTNGGVGGHAALPAELTMAAAHYNGHGVSSTIENFSDTGPYVYGDWQNGTQTRAKPDITGIDGVTVSGAGGFPSTFYGTSAASPNVASVIALLRSAYPGAESAAAGWNQLVTDNANPGALTNYTLNAGGAGLVDAAAALGAVDGSMTATITAPSGSPIAVDPNTGVAFNATCAYTGSQPLSYNWTFGGNSGIPSSSNLTPAPVQYANGGVYTVTFTCSDKYQSASDQKTINVQAAATADDQSLTTDYGKSVTGTFKGSGIGGEQVTYEVVQQPSHGSVQANGSSDGFVYTPDNGYSGSDSFTFDINNGVKISNTATVSITVKAAPAPSGGGGGGALGLGALGALLGLAGLLALRRRH